MNQPNSNPESGKVTRHLRLDPTPCKGKKCDFFARSQELGAVESALNERLKELHCLYGISQLVEEHRDSLPRLLQGIVELLPSSWHYPDLCCARVTLYDQKYEAGEFRESPWRQSAAIQVHRQPAGTVEVFYLQEMPALEEGPFLKEERDLIDAIAERIGRTVERFQVEQQLEIDRSSLQEANTALRRVLAEIEQEKVKIHDSIGANVEKILMPVLQALESEIPEQQKKYVALLKKHLADFVSPFALNVSKACGKLTPVEIEICDMVRSGMSTKEIARLRHVAPATVSKQRERIRRKLDIAKTETNLAAHLQMLSSDQSTRSNAIFQ
jgi:DNA-binding CsgD family transcriptional regulator